MNTNRISKLLLPLLFLAVLLGACADKTLRSYDANVPVYQSMEDWRATSFDLQDPQPLVHPGKIYIYGDYLFVNEFLEGVHFFDNSNPSNPQNLGFLPVLANQEMAVNNGLLYLDSYTDLLVFNITDILQPALVDRVEDVFSFTNFALLGDYDPAFPQAMVDPGLGVVVDWRVEKVTEEYVDRSYAYYNDLAMFDANSFGTSESGSFLGGAGIGGSTARFTIWADHLYTLEPNRLSAFNIQGSPSLVNTLVINRNCETLFPAQDHLFIGTTTGMLIYSLANPGSPFFLSQFDHALGCDPVVVAGDRAYVTLAAGRICGGNVNTLDVVDISDLGNPLLINSVPMVRPAGLGVGSDLLFVCDGPDGLKVYDRTDDMAIGQNLLRQFANLDARDVIPFNGNLIMTSAEGILQYSYLNSGNISQLSIIPIQP